MVHEKSMKQRMYNIDLCRIVAMLGILTLHYNLSGVLDVAEKGSAAYWTAWFLEVVFLCSVNVFAMMSGYLGWKKTEQRSKRLIELLASVFVECIAVTTVFLLFRRTAFESSRDYLIAVFPPLDGRLWYITCFIPLFMFQPYINRLLINLTEKQERNLCVLSLILLGCIPALTKVDFFHINDGYSFVWLCVCYTVGHYIRRSEQTINLRYGAYMFMGGVLLQFGVKIFTFYVLHKNSYYLMNYLSPFIILESVGMLMLFLRVKINKKWAQNIVAVLSSFAFDVYVLHCHPLVFDKLIEGMFNDVVSSGILAVLLCWVLFCTLAYLVFSLCGCIRVKAFKILKIDVLIDKIARKIDWILNMGEIGK